MTHNQLNRTLARLRRGYVSLAAMLFLVLASLMAAAFYSMVITSARAAGNDRQANQAMAAAESGMAFMRAQMTAAAPTARFTGTDSTQWTKPLCDVLRTQMEGTANLGAGTLTYSTSDASVTVNAIAVDRGATFDAVIKPSSDAKSITLTVTGYSGSVSRKLAVNFSGVPMSPGAPVIYPMVTRGKIDKAWNVTPDGSTKVKDYGDIVTVSIKGGGSGHAMVYKKNGMVAPTVIDFPNNDAVIQAIAALNLPAISGSTGATISGVPASSRILAGKNYTLAGTINGVIYVEWPNKITVAGPATINGTIVFERKGSKPGSSSFSLDRSADISRPMASSDTQIMNMGQSFTGKDQLKWWTLIAPDASLEEANGTTGGANKTFQGSLHFLSFSRQGGGNQPGFAITQGGMVAEGTIDIGSNGVSYVVDSDTSKAAGANAATSSLAMAPATYCEAGN